MRHERLVVSRIVGELMNFFFSMGARDFQARVARSDEGHEIVIESVRLLEKSGGKRDVRDGKVARGRARQ